MYLSHYGLKEEPFRLTPDPRFLHLAEPHRFALTTLLRGVLHHKGFLVLTGPVGTGKTTVLHAMLHVLSKKLLPGKKLISGLLVNPTLTREEFLETVLHEMELSCPTTKPQRLQVLQEALLEAQREGGTALLIVDEAHILSMDVLEEIRLLGNHDTHREKPLQIILCGQPELTDVLAAPQLSSLRQRVSARSVLRALSQSETRAYIAERLHVAGLRSASPFLAPAFDEIYRYSGGVPRLINLICDTSLAMGYDSGYTQIGRDVVQDAAVVLGIDAQPFGVAGSEIVNTSAQTAEGTG